MWDNDKEFTITIERNNEIITLSGITGSPKAKVTGIVEDINADDYSIKLRNSWLKN